MDTVNKKVLSLIEQAKKVSDVYASSRFLNAVWDAAKEELITHSEVEEIFEVYDKTDFAKCQVLKKQISSLLDIEDDSLFINTVADVKELLDSTCLSYLHDYCHDMTILWDKSVTDAGLTDEERMELFDEWGVDSWAIVGNNGSLEVMGFTQGYFLCLAGYEEIVSVPIGEICADQAHRLLQILTQMKVKSKGIVA